jgi:hypothetical protein
LVESFTEVALRGGDKCQKSTCVLRAPWTKLPGLVKPTTPSLQRTGMSVSE